MKGQILHKLHNFPANKEPRHLLLTDLCREYGQEVKEVLRELVKSGAVEFGNTINDTYFRLKPAEEHTITFDKKRIID